MSAMACSPAPTSAISVARTPVTVTMSFASSSSRVAVSTAGCSQISAPQNTSRITVSVPANQRMRRVRSVMMASSEEYLYMTKGRP